MALSPEEIEGREFGLSRRGYDPGEVDDFLGEVAATVRAAEATAETAEDQADAGGADDFERLGAEVAAVLRTADEGAAQKRAEAEAEATRMREEADTEANRVRDEADGYAHRLRVETEAEAERIRSEADVEARNARTALSEATEQARLTIQEAGARAEALMAEAEESAGARRQELLADAERQSGQAALVERDVHGRLLSVRDDLDQAVARLDPEASAAVAEQASALIPAGEGFDYLPYATDDDDDDAVIDLTDGPDGGADVGAGDLPYATDDEPLDLTDTGAADDIPPAPPPPPPPDHDSTSAATDLSEASDDADADLDTDDVSTDDPGEIGPDEADEDDDGDPLASMVRDAVGKAVQGAMRRRPGSDS